MGEKVLSGTTDLSESSQLESGDYKTAKLQTTQTLELSQCQFKLTSKVGKVKNNLRVKCSLCIHTYA